MSPSLCLVEFVLCVCSRIIIVMLQGHLVIWNFQFPFLSMCCYNHFSLDGIFSQVVFKLLNYDSKPCYDYWHWLWLYIPCYNPKGFVISLQPALNPMPTSMNYLIFPGWCQEGEFPWVLGKICWQYEDLPDFY